MYKRIPFLTLIALSSAFVFAQDAAIPLPDSLTAEGIPPVPQSIADSVGRYTEFRAASFQSWSPAANGGMLILTRFGDTSQVHSVAMPGGDRHQLTFFKEPINGAFFGPKSPDWFLFMKDIGGNEQFQYYRYDFATGDSTMLTDGKSRNTNGTLDHSGEHLLYNSTRRNGNDNDLYMVSVNDPKTDRLVTQLQGGGWGPADISDDGKTAILSNGISVNESHLFLVDLVNGKVTPLTPTSGPQIAYNNAVFARDGKSVYITSDENSEFQELRKMDIASGKTVSLTSSIPWDVEAVAITHDRSKIAFTVNNNGSDDIYVLDTANDKYHQAKNIPVGVISGLTWNAQGDQLAFSMSNAKSSSDAYSYIPRGDKLRRWTASETGGLDANNFQSQQLIKWKSFDGKEISGWLTMPPAKFSGPRPVMIDIHGGPEDQARPLFQGRYNYYINELGIAVIEPNVRGSTGFGKSFMKLDNGILRADTYKDIGALLDWVGTQSNLNAKKVMITGGSYGGHMTYAISYVYADRIACSLPVVGITNLVTFLENTSGYRRDLRRVEYGDERDPAVRKVLEDIAPMNHASEITKPIFIVAGQNDPRVPITEATQFETKIKDTNANTWFLVGKDEGHGFAKKKNRDYQMYATVLFMQKFLLGP